MTSLIKRKQIEADTCPCPTFSVEANGQVLVITFSNNQPPVIFNPNNVVYPPVAASTDVQTTPSTAVQGNTITGANGQWILTTGDTITITLDIQNGTTVDNISQPSPNGLRWNITAPSFLQWVGAVITPTGGVALAGSSTSATQVTTGAAAIGGSAIVTLTYIVLPGLPQIASLNWVVSAPGMGELLPTDNNGSIDLEIL